MSLCLRLCKLLHDFLSARHFLLLKPLSKEVAIFTAAQFQSLGLVALEKQVRYDLIVDLKYRDINVGLFVNTGEYSVLSHQVSLFIILIVLLFILLSCPLILSFDLFHFILAQW